MMAKSVDTSAAAGKRLPPAEVARWVVAAAHHGVRETWIAKQPVLFLSEWTGQVQSCDMAHSGACRCALCVVRVHLLTHTLSRRSHPHPSLTLTFSIWSHQSCKPFGL